MVKIERVFHQKVSILPSINLLHQTIGKLRQWAPQANHRPGFKLAIASPMARTSQLSTIDSHDFECRSNGFWQAPSRDLTSRFLTILGWVSRRAGVALEKAPTRRRGLRWHSRHSTHQSQRWSD